MPEVIIHNLSSSCEHIDERNFTPNFATESDPRHFLGGSDARIIMGDDESALLRLWREKRGEAEPEDLSDNLVVQLGSVTEDLNRRWYEFNTGLTSGTSRST